MWARHIKGKGVHLSKLTLIIHSFLGQTKDIVKEAEFCFIFQFG